MPATELFKLLAKGIGSMSLVYGIAKLPQAVQMLHQYGDEQELLRMLSLSIAAPAIQIIGGLLAIRASGWLAQLAMSNNLTGRDALDSPADYFVVVLKVMGLWSLIDGAMRLPYELVMLQQNRLFGAGAAAYSGIYLVAGCFLLFATD